MGSKVEAVLDALQARYTSAEGWNLVSRQDDGTEMFYKDVSETRSLVRSSFTLDEPLEQVIAVLRPEVWLPNVGRMSENRARGEIVKRYAAGDVVGKIDCNSKHAGCPIQAVLLQAKVIILGNNPLAGWYRAVLRRDVIGPGSAVVLEVPLDPERYELRERYGLCFAKVTMLSQTSDGRTHFSRVTSVERSFRWAWPLLSTPLCTKREAIAGFVKEFHAKADEEAFLVVRIRKCVRGPPLLPVSWPHRSTQVEDVKVSWLPSVDCETDFQLSVYLARLLATLGFSDVHVFEQLDGRRVVFYQAVVRKADWQQVSPVVDAALQVHRAIYRHTFGGSGAPYIDCDVEPRYCFRRDGAPGAEAAAGDVGPKQAAGPQPPESRPEDGEEDWPWMPLPVKNTFIDFAARLADVETMSAP